MSAGAGPLPIVALAVFLAVVGLQRFIELRISSRHVRRLLARGAHEYGGEHYAWIVALHALFPAALVTEAVLGARPPRLWPLWLAFWLGAQALRFAAMRGLGERWTTRVLVVPDEPAVRHGIYRWLRHPNYVAVALELTVAPLMFGAWRTAVAFSVANLALLSVRIRCEERALAAAEPPV